jgi:hypothetical protein
VPNQEIDRRYDEVLVQLWIADERRATLAPERVRLPDVVDPRRTLQGMHESGLIATPAGPLVFTPRGRSRARDLIRRRRLAEVLFSSALHLPDDEVETTACLMEHVIDPTVADSICSFLGHPAAARMGDPSRPGTAASCPSFMADGGAPASLQSWAPRPLRTPMPPRTLPPTSVAVLLVAVLFAPPATATGVPIGPAPGEAHSRPVVLPDGAGGAVVALPGRERTRGRGACGREWRARGLTGVQSLAGAVPARICRTHPGLAGAQRARAGGVGPCHGQRCRTHALRTRRCDGARLSARARDAVAPPRIRDGFAGPHARRGHGRRCRVVLDRAHRPNWAPRASSCPRTSTPSQLQFFNSDRLDATTDGAGGLVAVRPYYDGLQTGSKDLCVFRLAADGSTPWGSNHGRS